MCWMLYAFFWVIHTYPPVKWNRQHVPKRWHIKFRGRRITQKKAYKNLKRYGSDKPELPNIYELPDWLFHDLDRKLDFHVISKDFVPLEEQFWYIITSLKLGNLVALPAGMTCGNSMTTILYRIVAFCITCGRCTFINYVTCYFYSSDSLL